MHLQLRSVLGGAHVISTDEKTSIQALEHLFEAKPVRPGLVERVEFEYIRHGTLCLMANFDVATGRVVSPSIGPTRTEKDFVVHVEKTIEVDPEASWIFIVDQLDTHVSAGLVELVARQCGFEDELGGKVRRESSSPRRRGARSYRTSLIASASSIRRGIVHGSIR
jgi:hypothetical protein